MEVKKIVEGMTAPQVAQVIDDNFKAQNKILEEDIATQNSVIGVSEYKDFSEVEAVSVGDVRKYNGFLYECVEATTGAFDASKWKKSSFKAETEKKLSELESERLYTILGLSNGSINTKGTFIGAENRICTNFISGVFTIGTANGFRIRSVAKYDKESLNFLELVTIYNTSYANSGDYIVRIIIDNYDESAISINDNIFSFMKGGDFVDSYGIKQTQVKADNNESNLRELSYKVDLSSIIIENGGIQPANGVLTESDTRVRTKNYIKGNITIEVPSGIQIAYVLYFNEDTLSYESHESVYASKGTFGKDGYVFKLTFCRTDRNLPINYTDIKSISDLDKLSASVADINSKVSKEAAPAMVKFDFNHKMLDVASRLNVMGVSSSRGAIEKVYKAFDRLVALYPNFVSKFDPMAASDTTETINVDGEAYTINIYAMADIKASMASKGVNDYPIYCKGISEVITQTLNISDGSTYDVTYDITPAYKTYVYRLKDESIVNTELNKKKKAFIVGGLHGNELAAPMNLAIFASLLCDGFLEETNYYKLRASFDFYILPYINGYGSYHGTRANANQVDLNRNFPCSVWNLSGKETIGDANLSTFSGGLAGSEFETKLIMSLTEYINPDFALDHHNYGNGGNQLYSEIPRFPQIAQQASVDMAIAFAKNFPQYYGNKYLDTLFGSTAGAPGFNQGLLLAHVYTWWYEKSIKFPTLIEIGNSIDWVNGEQVGNDSNWLSADTFSVGEYTLRIQLLRYMQYLLDNYNAL